MGSPAIEKGQLGPRDVDGDRGNNFSWMAITHPSYRHPARRARRINMNATLGSTRVSLYLRAQNAVRDLISLRSLTPGQLVFDPAKETYTLHGTIGRTRVTITLESKGRDPLSKSLDGFFVKVGELKRRELRRFEARTLAERFIYPTEARNRQRYAAILDPLYAATTAQGLTE
jgi:hypothetical protein